MIHVGSVSKTLAPALRLGWLIAPEPWRERLLASRSDLDHGLPALEQHALADFISAAPTTVTCGAAAAPTAAAATR